MSITEENFNLARSKALQTPFASRNYIRAKGQKGYWRYRIFRPVLKLRYSQYCKKNPQLPWLTPDSIEALKHLLQPNFTALEYGSGRSTQYFSQKVAKLYSVEHHEAWYKEVTKQLEHARIKNTELILRKPDESLPEHPMSSESQAFMVEEDYPVKDEAFTSYTSCIDSFDDEFFDFILVDGRARRTCALKAIKKLKAGGILVLDNSERVRYKAVHDSLKDWNYILTTTGLTDTTIWHKPY